VLVGMAVAGGLASAPVGATTLRATAPLAASVLASATASSSSVVVNHPVAFGDAATLGYPEGKLKAPLVGIAAAPDGLGYWLVASDGGVFNYGSAHFYGSAGALQLKSPIVGMAAAPDGKGYWLVAADGGVVTYGSARFYGSAGALTLKSPVVGMAAAPDGKGYWLVAADGGVFAYGSAKFHGSAGAIELKSPVVGMSAAPGGDGYWLVAADGGVFTYGSARFKGSAGALKLVSPIVGMATSPVGIGYWLVASNGGVFTYGNARYRGSEAGSSVAAVHARIAGLVPTPQGSGYWMLPLEIPPPPPPPAPPVEPTVSEGDSGPAVTLLQKELLGLGYWVDTTDGSFDDSTQQAVWAIEKAAGLTTDGVAGPAVWGALFHHVLPTIRSASGYLIEVNLNTDLVMVINNDKIQWVLNTSTGGGYTYTDSTGTYVAQTPTGVFNTYTAINGLVTDSLGQLWRPRYFTGGFAIHGDGDVPPYPVSHGCVRVSNEAINWIWANNIDPIGTEVWVYN
jgi:lipoprotein-anchoring transpeptidase ErfK/SrfK